jgi:peptidoglycan/LPS O-acetylase OafA/YrhL
VDGENKSISILPVLEPGTHETRAPEQALPNLDLLRAYAVMLVVACHLLAFLRPQSFVDGTANRIGHFGVLLFFVHTAFVLLLSLDRQGPTAVQRTFFIRRFFRIYPLSALLVVVTAAFQLPLARVFPDTFEALPFSLVTATANLLLAQNLLGTPSIVGQLWSLPYEVQMYLALPGIFILVRKHRFSLLVVGLWVVAILAALGERSFRGEPGLLWYVPNFLGGVLAYCLWSKASTRLSYLYWFLILAAALPAYLLMARYETEAGWLLCLALGFLIPRFAQVPFAVLNRLTSRIAQYSYGIYLAHTLAMWLAFSRLPLPAILQWPVFIVLLAVFPMLLYHFVEAPMIRLGRRKAASGTVPRLGRAQHGSE